MKEQTTTTQFEKLPFEQFMALGRAEKAAYIAQAVARFDSQEGEKLYMDLDQLRGQYMFGQVTADEYTRRVYQVGPACYQFGELVNFSYC